MAARKNLRAGTPTRRKGVTYRSQLESRWAAWFQSHGWTVEYEPGRLLYPGGSYLPDFRWKNPRLHNVPLSLHRVYIEIKPNAEIAEKEIQKAYPALDQMDALIVLSSNPPLRSPIVVNVLATGLEWEHNDRGYYYTNMFIGDNNRVHFTVTPETSSGLTWRLNHERRSPTL